jgi:hypothetical protein
MNVRMVRVGVAAAAALAAISPVLPPILSAPAGAQTTNSSAGNAIPEAVATTIHAKIRLIDPQIRHVTLTGPSSRSVTVTAGELVRLDMLKVGDTVNAKYYRSVAFTVSSSMDVAPDATAQIVEQNAPGGIGVRLTRVSGLIVGIDLASNSVEMADPTGGGVHTIHVTDPARAALLSTLKVGDTITAVIS